MRRTHYIRFLLTTAALAASLPAFAQTLPALPDTGAPAVEGPVLAAPESEIIAPLAPAPRSDADRYSEVIAPPPAETVEGLIARRLAESKDTADLRSFYEARQNAPLWIADNKLTPKALAVLDVIRRADEEGLDPTAFFLPDPAASEGSPEQLAAAEIALSRAASAYARQAQGGRLVPSSLGPLITPDVTRPSRDKVLNVMASHDDAADWLQAYNPPHEPYKALKKKLAELRAAEKGPVAPPPPQVPAAKKSLKPGMQDARVPVLRERLGVERVMVEAALPEGGVESVESLVYDEPLIEAVKTFQQRHGLNVDGIVGSQTVALMNDAAKVEDPIPLILANMERWRWLPRELGQTHIFVNVPEYMGRIVRGGEVIHETRVITGSKQHQSPIFSDEMDHIIVNPAWNVPYSIALKEMLPQLQRDPAYLARQGYEVIYTGQKKPVLLDSARIDWTTVDAKTMSQVRIRQPPGEANALGHIKFMFPNKHAVYLHDTPTRHLFARDMRALSHGCIRVQDPFQLADVLLEDTGLDGAKLKSMVGGSKENRINLAHKIPIHITYFTAEVLPDGSLLSRPDVYGTDRKMKAALGLGGQLQASAKN